MLSEKLSFSQQETTDSLPVSKYLSLLNCTQFSTDLINFCLVACNFLALLNAGSTISGQQS